MFALISILYFQFLTSAGIPVLDKWSIYSGDIFSVTCDLKSFENLLGDAPTLTFLSTERKTAFDPKFTNIATYGTNTPIKSIPHGRPWTILFNKGKDDTVNSASIVLQVKDACCSDAGLYRCTAMLNDMEKVESNSTELKCNDLVDKKSLKKEINADGKTEFTCVFSSMLKLKVQWKYRVNKQNEEESLPYLQPSNVQTVGPVNSFDCRGCKEFFYMSKLFLDVTETEKEKTYFCTGYNGTANDS